MTTDKQAVELLPCPFCGGPAKLVGGFLEYPAILHAGQPHCPIRQGPFTAEQWNTRASLTQPKADDAAQSASTFEAQWFVRAIRDHDREHGPSGGAWNISMILERLQRNAPKADEDVVKAVARAIGRTQAKAGGPIGAYLWDVDLANAARAAIAALPTPPTGD